MCSNITEQQGRPNGWLVALLVIILLLLLTHRASAQTAQIDTMLCKVECIEKIVVQPSANGKSQKYFAVYKDSKLDFNEIISVPKSVVTYIETCKANNLKPNLGIRLRNGVVSSIVRYKTKFIKR